MLGHSLNLSSNWMTLIWTALLAMGTGIIAGIYPAFYITSFPPAMAISGSFSLTDRAKITRKILIASQYVISIGYWCFICCVTKQIYRKNRSGL